MKKLSSKNPLRTLAMDKWRATIRVCNFIRVTIVVTAVILSQYAYADESVPTEFKTEFQDLKEFNLHIGVNKIALSPLGKPGAIIFLFHDTGTSGSHLLYISVIADNTPSIGSWSIIPVDLADGSSADIMSDNPHEGDDVIKSVRYFKAIHHGKKITILIVAERDLSSTLTPLGLLAATPTKISIYQLEPDAPEFGRLGEFSLTLQYVTRELFTNADDALWHELSIPLRH